MPDAASLEESGGCPSGCTHSAATRHTSPFRLGALRPMTNRMDVFPDGGLARVRLYGSMDPAQRRMIGFGWFNALPETHARAVIRAARRTASAPRNSRITTVHDTAGLPEALLRCSVGVASHIPVTADSGHARMLAIALYVS